MSMMNPRYKSMKRRGRRVPAMPLTPELQKKLERAIELDCSSRISQLGVARVIEDDAGDVDPADLEVCAARLRSAAQMQHNALAIFREIRDFNERSEGETTNGPSN